MSPQFVDFNQDGKLDIVAGIFDGSPHVALANDKGWQQPVQILDHKGERILLNQWWNFDSKKWENTNRCDPQDIKLPSGQGTSAWAFDWDHDGDFDLLLGDYTGGRLYLRQNDGTNREPEFATTNIPVMAGKQPLEVPHKMATPRMLDWDGDGLLDLVIGTVGDAYGKDEGGAVYLFRNVGKQGAPEFAAPLVLIEPSHKAMAEAPTRPDAGLYMDVGDIDGDGDLDLIVGGYSMWQPKAVVLTDEQKARVAVLQQELAKVDAEFSGIYAAIGKAVAGLDEAAAKDKRAELTKEKQKESSALQKRRAEIRKELEPLVAEPKRESFVWLYENVTGKAAEAAGKPK